MSERIKELKQEIKELRSSIKNTSFPATKSIYERQLVDAELSLRHHKLVKRVTDFGIDYDEWEEWARSLYNVDENFTVTSKARDWKEEMSWSSDSDVGARERIAKLIGYKIKDRQRGRGDIDKDLAEAK